MDFRWAATPEERAELWHARHQAYYAALALRPGARAWTTDVSVPISRLAECILDSKRDNEGSFLLAPLVGHAGDGKFHLIYLIDPGNPAELAEASATERPSDRSRARAWGTWRVSAAWASERCMRWQTSTDRDSRSCGRSSARSIRTT